MLEPLLVIVSKVSSMGPGISEIILKKSSQGQLNTDRVKIRGMSNERILFSDFSIVSAREIRKLISTFHVF